MTVVDCAESVYKCVYDQLLHSKLKIEKIA